MTRLAARAPVNTVLPRHTLFNKRVFMAGAGTTKTFAYTALSSSGERISSQIRAESEAAVLTTLHSRGLQPLTVKEKKAKMGQMQIGGKKLKGADQADFTRQVFAMINAGIPVVDSLRSVARTTKNKEMKKMYMDIADKIQEGHRFSTALERYPKSFDSVYVSYIQAGEATGNMKESMGRLVTSLDKKVKLRRKVVSVMTYPVLVTGFIFVIVGAILLFLVPQFESLYSQLGGDLPGPTKMLMVMSRGMVKYWWTIPVLIFLIWLFFRQTRNNLEIGTIIDKIKFRLPLIGSLLHKLSLFRWSETLAGSLEAGVQTIDAIDLAASASGSRWHRSVAPELAQTLKTGRKLSDVMPNHSALYPLNIQTMISTGERTGELPEMLGRVANALDDEVDNIVGQLSSTLEVALLASMGIVVGGIMIALYLPIFNAPALLN